MSAARSRATCLLLATLGLVAAVSGCSPARLVLPAGQTGARPSHLPERRPFDLMPHPAARDVARHGSPRSATGTPQPSPDGKWIAYESDQDSVHGVWVARPDGERARRVSGSRLALMPRWSPDGTQLMFLARDARGQGGWNIWIADPDAGTARKLTAGNGVAIAGASWFPDSRRICYGTGNWLVVADAVNGSTRGIHLPSESARIMGTPAVSPDGRRVIFAVEGDGAWMASLADGAVTQVLSEQDVDAFAWAPGGRQIAFRTSRDGQWRVRTLK